MGGGERRMMLTASTPCAAPAPTSEQEPRNLCRPIPRDADYPSVWPVNGSSLIVRYSVIDAV